MSLSISKFAVATGLATGTLLSCFGTSQAHATGFKFVGTYSQTSSSTADILLESITVGDQIIDEFSYVTSAEIIYNDVYSGGNTGAASADTGDDATGGARAEDATAADVVANLSTNNINHIIDTEDKGRFEIDLNFSEAIKTLFVWERGMNSDLGIQAVNADGELIGSRLDITRNMWFDTGFKIDTSEINNAQKVGSLGIKMADLGVEGGEVSTLRFFSQSGFNGPDWKFVGTTAKVPEPALMLGLGLVGGALAWQKRAKAA
ncbi:exosortase-dependent surface protein XDP2 [Leptolyngbya iicbica]|uniref:PEP-CTERM sorting domain-containing protein n=2 Tax=Cyanophyceae TaxID=3028117 RepID=A0A4Q7E836_9CYAN|nr:exosortase-dependent surface protein XDP2 [Leptolyngbya sp. LK]RZM78957.1 PEP-CTERM sorting domain-containing protein [Leptolyngbya sp. LK]